MFNNIINSLKLLTVSFLIYLILLRFSPRISKYLFENVSFIQGIFYELLLLVNVVILSYMLYIKIYKQKKPNILITDITYWIKKSYEKFMDYLFLLPYMDPILAYLTRALIKTSLRVITFLYFGSRIGFMLALCLDTFYYNMFYLSYKLIYLLIIPLAITAILELCLYANRYISAKISSSIVICKYDRALNGEPLLLEDYELSENNDYYTSVEEALLIRQIIMEQYTVLWTIKDCLNSYTNFRIFIRIAYVIIWSYIVYYYPLPIITYTCTVIYKSLVQYPQLLFIITVGILYLSLRKKI